MSNGSLPTLALPRVARWVKAETLMCRDVPASLHLALSCPDSLPLCSCSAILLQTFGMALRAQHPRRAVIRAVPVYLR